MWTPPDPTPAATHWPQITSPPTLFMQRENTVFRVDTTSGPHALRLHRPGYHSPATLQSELDLMAMLAGQGMRVPTPAPSAKGALLVPIADRYASLLSWLPGAPMSRSGHPLTLTGPARAALYQAIGAQMARLHALTDRWTPPPGFTRPRWDRDGLIGDTPTWGRFWDHSATTALRDLARATLDTAPPQDIGLIHADLVNENVLLDGPHVHFIDFDDSGIGYRLFDLATTLYAAADEPDFPTLQAALLSGYSQHRTLPDLSLLPLFIVLRSLSYLGWIATRSDTPAVTAKSNRYQTLANRLIDRYLS